MQRAGWQGRVQQRQLLCILLNCGAKFEKITEISTK